MSLICRQLPVMAATHTSIRAEIDFAETIFLHETTKIRTTTTAEGTVHSFGTCMEGFEVVCNVMHTVMLAIPAQNQPQSPQSESCQWGLPGQAYGCVVP